MPPPRAIAIDLDGALGDTRPLWQAWLADSTRVLGIDTASLPPDRADAAEMLDAAGSGNWRALLSRYAEDRAPVYLRPSAEAAGAMRALRAAGARLGVFSDAPDELVAVALPHVGAARRVDVVAGGRDALERVLAQLGQEAAVARTRDDLVWLADPGHGLESSS